MMGMVPGFYHKSTGKCRRLFAFHKIPPAPMFPEQYHLETMCGIVWCCIDEEEANEVFDTVRNSGNP